MDIIQKIKNKISSFLETKIKLDVKKEVPNLKFDTIHLEKIISFIFDDKIEDAVALYSTTYQEFNHLKISENTEILRLLEHEKSLPILKKFKKRYYEFLLSIFVSQEEVISDLFYGEYKKQIKEVQNTLFFNINEEGSKDDFFTNRIDEWKIIFNVEDVPYLTKSLLYNELESFNMKNDDELFKSLIAVTPLYFLRKMQLAALDEFIVLFKILDLFGEGKKLKILDYGCGSADLSLYCAINGHDITICDVEGGNLDAAKKRFDLRNVPVHTIGATHNDPIPEITEKYDLIIALEVIEHIRYPEKLLKMFDDIIEQKGIIMLGSFPFKGTNATGDHLVEAVSKQKSLLNYINSNWKRVESKEIGNTFIKE